MDLQVGEERPIMVRDDVILEAIDVLEEVAESEDLYGFQKQWIGETMCVLESIVLKRERKPLVERDL